MNPSLSVQLNASPAQREQLRQLQAAFATVCNALAPLVQQSRCWNRVALHHMTYKQLRERFPDLGSQMVCNAIYSVSRASRHVYQHPASRFNVSRLGDRALPRLQFLPQAPVYFDRHTLSLKAGQASMYTLDGRIRFQLGLSPEDERRFREHKLREIVLTSRDGQFYLTFHFAEPLDPANEAAGSRGNANGTSAELPQYLIVIEDPAPATAPVISTAQAALPL